MTVRKQHVSDEENEPFFALSNEDKARFLMLFIANMTVAVRDAYLLEPTDCVEMLRAWNELLHRVADTLLAISENSDTRFPDKVLFSMIKGEKPIHKQVAWALERAYTFLNSPQTSRRNPKAAAH